MRITNNVLLRNYLNNLDRNLQNASRYQEQLSSGKQIRKPSDNPFDVSRSMELNASNNRNLQYKKNIDDAKAWLNVTDQALSEISDSLQRISELVTAAANGTNSDTELYAYKTEIEQIIEGIVEAGNTNLNGKYVFGGYKTTTPPFSKDTALVIKYSGDTNVIQREISPEVGINISIPGNRILGTSPNDLQSVLGNILNDLNTGQNSNLSNYIGNINSARDNILNLRAEVGAKTNRLDSVSDKIDEEIYNTTEVLSKFEDIDVAQKYMEYKLAETVYQSSLMIGAQILQPSLLNYLR